MWRHVPTADNPADCASRGIYGDEIVHHRLWWSGPPWLLLAPNKWPVEPPSCHTEPPVDERPRVHYASRPPDVWSLASRYSSWSKLMRITAYIHRFVRLCRREKPHDSSSHPSAITAVEYAHAETYWIQSLQSHLFSSEIQALSAGRSVTVKSILTKLSPFLDKNRVLRVGGRLQNSLLPYDARHPAVLAAHPLVRLLIHQIHLRHLHSGTQLTLSVLRRNFWLLRARSIVKSVIHECVYCSRERSAVPTQLMGNLPSGRVSPSSRCFAHCGVDYAGPVKVRASSGRGIAARKAYIALFVCLATRAIHLELVSDLTTSAFKSAFSRFCSRRGIPQSVYSDNGTTFVGADKELAIAYRTALQDANFLGQTASDGIQWTFIPPSAPHFGGLWEAGVRSTKYHLRRVLGTHTLTFEELTTLLYQIEACLNSRFIAPLSDDIEDFQSLTPGHFLIGTPLTVPPEPSVLELPENRISRWQIVRHIVERFWKLWTTDYLNTLQQRSKWRKRESSIKVGQLALLRNPLLPPCKWELGRVVKIHPGPDGLVRVVTIRTAASEYVRPIGKICILPVDTSQSETA